MNGPPTQAGRNRARHFILGAGAGLAFVVLAIFVALVATGQAITLRNIARVHASQPVLFVFYLLPPFYALVIWYYLRITGEMSARYRKQISKKDGIIDRYAEYARKIGQGNYSESIEPENEQDILGKSLLVMSSNLAANHKKESEQNWISEGRNIISNVLRIHNRLDDLGAHVLEELVKYIDAVQGTIYLIHEEEDKLTCLSTYAYGRQKYISKEFRIGHGLIGQCAYEKDYIYRTEIPEDYCTVSSGLIGDKKPRALLLVPLISENNLQGVMETAFIQDGIPELTIRLVMELGEIIARTIFNLRINRKTEELLEESQKMTVELKKNEELLRENAEEMKATQEELEKSNLQLESKISEAENARLRLHSLLENASEIISIYDRDRQLTYVSPSVVRILGYSTEEMMQGKDTERLSLQGQKDLGQLFEKLTADPERPVTIEITFVRKDGEMVSLETTGRNLLEDPSVSGILLNSRDITERRRAEKEERMKSRMQSLSENSLDMIIRLGVEGRVYYANPVVEDYTGRSPADLINKNLSEVRLPGVLQEHLSKALYAMTSGPKKSNAVLTIPANIEEYRLERIMSIDAIPETSGGDLETVLFVGHDITEAKRIEREIQVKNKKIEDSINYAERIQGSILPETEQIRETFSRSFIFYKPRDVISGDFPWYFPGRDSVYIAAVDCTGHGVPGALLSFVGYFLLNNLAGQPGDYTAGEICDRLHSGVRHTLKQNRPDADARDGMDLSLCKIELKTGILHYCGAHRPLYFVRNGELTEYKGDRKAIGGIPSKKKPEKPFTNHVIRYEKGDRIFFFSDGLPDQEGGPDGKKYTPRRIRDMILKNQGFTMKQYMHLFMEDFENWSKGYKQLDDVLMIGLEF